MRGKSMILIIIALGCGLVASIGISQIMDQGKTPQGPQVATEKIFVTLVDVDINETITPQMVKLEEWPKDRVPEGAITDLAEIEGLAPSQRLYPGEPVLRAKLIDPNSVAGVSRTIPKGFRVMAVKVSMDTVVAGLIQPGDRVDVLVYLRKSGGIDVTGTLTILKNVRVFAVDSRTGRDLDAEGNSVAVKTISVLVMPKQVEKLLLASRLGQISLSLRPPDDESVESGDDDSTDIGDLMNGGQNATPKKEPQVASVEDSFIDLMNRQGASPPPAAPAPEPKKPGFRILILEPEVATTYEFGEKNELPQVVQPGAGTISTPPPALPSIDTFGAPDAGVVNPASADSRGANDVPLKDDTTRGDAPIDDNLNYDSPYDEYED